MQKLSYKYRIYPTKEQKVLLAKTFGCVRKVWNCAVAEFLEKKPMVSSTELRKEFDFMTEVSAAALQQKQRDFIEFKNQFFDKKRKKPLGPPTFKKKIGRQSFRLPNQKFKILNHGIKIEKVGFLKTVFDRVIPKESKLLSVTISKDPSGSYFASVNFEANVEPRFEKTGESVGIDLGLTHFAVLSNGEKVENPRYFRKNQAKLTKAQQRFDKKKKGSNRRRKAGVKVSRIHKKIRNSRSWFHHNTVNQILKRFDNIKIETLGIEEMLQNPILAKSISDAGWHQFALILSYKALWNQKAVERIERFAPTTKTCSFCQKGTDLELSDRQWECACGATHDRDVNAAINILNAQGVACA